MHDGHPHGSCADCARFAAPFAHSTGLDEWGYCRTTVGVAPAPSDLAALESAFRAGDRTPLRQNRLGLFRAAPDDCCDLFESRVH